MEDNRSYAPYKDWSSRNLLGSESSVKSQILAILFFSYMYITDARLSF